MMSTRRDLFPLVIADQLALLQDRVAPFDGALARKHIELAMGGSWKPGLMILIRKLWHPLQLLRYIQLG